MIEPTRLPGWDKQAVNEIAREQYGGLREMFEAHGWETNGRVISQIAPTKAVETYGSIEGFVRAHAEGRASNPMLDPLAAIRSDPPEVFLKSFHGFDPESWGFLGYTEAASREKFIRESKPGALLVVCATSKAPNRRERLRVLGMQQQSHVRGTKWDYLSPERHEAERNDPARENSWYHAVKSLRAWRIPEEAQPFVRDIFPDTHAGGHNGTAIGSYGLRLTSREALRLLELPFYEVSVFGGAIIQGSVPGPAEKVLFPSKPGPVSQSAYLVKEAEGPKHLYVLQLNGQADAFLGYGAGGHIIVKVGFSVSPRTRCHAHNRALPACAFRWDVRNSTHDEGRTPFPSSKHGLAGEAEMKKLLSREGKSLGGEFFLAHPRSVERAWNDGIAAAENWK